MSILHVSHFRTCVVYLSSGQDAFDYFKNDPNLFDVVSYFSSLFYYWHRLILKDKWIPSCHHIVSS
jgi:hypothetical protein